MENFWQSFSWLNDAYGINLTILYDDIDRTRFLSGILTTLKLSAVCIVASIIIGIAGAWLQMSRFVAVRAIVDAYIQFFRNTPPLIQMYFFYFAVDAAMVDALRLSGSVLGSFGWAALSLSFFAGAFNVEIFRSGIEAVPRSTEEAAESLGFTKLQIYRYVTLPLGLRVCLPSLGSNLINLVKTTTVAYAIAVPETLYMANQIWSDEFNVPEMMNVVWLVYLALVGLLVWAIHRLEHAIRIPGYGQR